MSSANFLRTHNSSYGSYDSTASGFRSPLCRGGIPGEASAVWDAELSCSAPACRACCPDLQTSTGHDANFGTPAVPCHWLPCVEFVLHPTPAASQAGASTSITTSRRPITREPRAPSASSQWRRGETHPRTGAMERRCHTADHSLSAESCNGTPFSGILKAVLALGCSRLLSTAGISCHLHCPLACLARLQGIFDLQALISSDSSLQPRYSASFARQQRLASWIFI